jgi:hypothetical protein
MEAPPSPCPLFGSRWWSPFHRELSRWKTPVRTAEVFCLWTGTSSVSSRPPETLRPQCPQVSPFHPRNLAQTHTPACAPPGIPVCPDPGKGPPPPPVLSNTHIPSDSSLPNPVEAAANTWTGRALRFKWGGRGPLRWCGALLYVPVAVASLSKSGREEKRRRGGGKLAA